MNVLLSHPTGNANVRAMAKGFSQEGALRRFYTSIATFPESLLDMASQLPGMAELRRRSFDGSLRGSTRMYPWYELGRLLSQKSGFEQLTKHETGLFCVDHVYQHFDRHVAGQLNRSKALEVVYAYEDGAQETFEKAKKMGITCVYELPIAHWQTSRRLLLEEASRLPEWAGTLEGGIIDSQQKLARKDRELELADVVVTPGNFVADSLKGYADRKKVIISPFGSPQNLSFQRRNGTSRRKLRVLFVGHMGQRKGLGDLFEAIRLLGSDQVELVVLGSLLQDLSFYKSQLPHFTYEPTRPHAEVLRLMRECDVFCLPSIVEGRALVIQEAMSQGLPIIITENTGGADLVIDGETGFLVPIRDPEAIAGKLQWCLQHSRRLDDMGERAHRHSASYTWTAYTDRIIQEIKNFLTANA
jgi:glycosyltransferase involved in cell wall biosynthesis